MKIWLWFGQTSRNLRENDAFILRTSSDYCSILSIDGERLITPCRPPSIRTPLPTNCRERCMCQWWASNAHLFKSPVFGQLLSLWKSSGWPGFYFFPIYMLSSLEFRWSAKRLLVCGWTFSHTRNFSRDSHTLWRFPRLQEFCGSSRILCRYIQYSGNQRQLVILRSVRTDKDFMKG